MVLTRVVCLCVRAYAHNHFPVCVTVCAAAAGFRCMWCWWSGFHSQCCEVARWKLPHGGRETSLISCRDRSAQTGRQTTELPGPPQIFNTDEIVGKAFSHVVVERSFNVWMLPWARDVSYNNKTLLTLFNHTFPQNIVAMSCIIYPRKILISAEYLILALLWSSN